jgi:Ca2+-binding EF-hand superfamily protein
MRPMPFILGGVLCGICLVAAAQDRPRQPQDDGKRVDPARMLERFDKNGDGVLEASEIPERMKERFAPMDLNKDGKLTKEELRKAAGRTGKPSAGQPKDESPDALFRLLDANGDGKLSEGEIKSAADVLKKLDKNKDGIVDKDEAVAPAPAARKGKGGRPGEIITPAAKGERHQDKLKLGDMAPDFTLPDMTGKKQVTLSSFRGKKPVVLVFASYT